MAAGKGLEALITKKAAKATNVTKAGKAPAGVFYVEVTKIVGNPHQPRKDFSRAGLAELASSIRSHGILQPLVVEKVERETKKGVEVLYHLLAGERRLRAAKLVGLKTVPVVIRQASDDRTRLLVALIENIQREDLNAMERAEAYARLRDEFGLSQEEIARRVGKSREAVANTLRLLSLPDAMRAAIRKGELSEGHARALLSVEGKRREQLFAEMKERPMSVREAETMARQMQPRKPPVRVADPRRALDEERLYKRFGVPVRITTRRNRASVSFIVQSRDQLRELLRRLLG